MAKKITLIGLDELDLTNDDLFIKKEVTDFDVDARVIVDETHQAILIKNGQLTETLSPGTYPIFDRRIGLFKTEKIGSFRVELVYFSRTAKLKALWGTRDLIDFCDPATGIPVKIGASGEFEVKVKNARQFYLELIGAEKHFTVDTLKERLQGRIANELEPSVAYYMREKGLSYSAIAEYKQILSAAVLPKLSKLFDDEYGLEISSFIISRIVLDDVYKTAIEAELERRKKAENGLYCIECGALCDADAKFCAECGAKLSDGIKVCAECGADNIITANYCRKCGSKF